jgi:hypothetical protein
MDAANGGPDTAQASDGRLLSRIPLRIWLFASAAIIGAQALVLHAMGRVAICKCGYVKFWHGVVHSSENSQHISDWYSFSHVIHGFIFYWLLSVFARRLPRGFRLVLAVLAEATWEVIENSPVVIDRYRATTISLDYYGDSILNSVSDVVFCVLGFALARRLPAGVTIALALAMELVVGYWIRDNLTLNIIMLIWPLEAIRRWQEGAAAR